MVELVSEVKETVSASVCGLGSCNVAEQSHMATLMAHYRMSAFNSGREGRRREREERWSCSSAEEDEIWHMKWRELI